MMFIATINGGDASVPVFVTIVLYRIGVPALTTVASLSMDIWRGGWEAFDFCCDWPEAMTGKKPRQPVRTKRITGKATELPQDRLNLLALPASSRRPGLAYKKSRTKMMAANTTGETSHDAAFSIDQLLTITPARKFLGAPSGLAH
jgi:hypothetical protein